MLLDLIQPILQVARHLGGIIDAHVIDAGGRWCPLVLVLFLAVLAVFRDGFWLLIKLVEFINRGSAFLASVGIEGHLVFLYQFDVIRQSVVGNSRLAGAG